MVFDAVGLHRIFDRIFLLKLRVTDELLLNNIWLLLNLMQR